ncbi:MAG: SWIM zinc finger family protein [Candidatus Anammoxibacter sp.]
MGYWGRRFPEYVSVGAKKAKAEKKLQQLKNKNPNINPIIIEGMAIAKSWWGKSWNRNLEKYADYSNRIGRGRSYVRHGAVLDLRIGKGEVNSLVQGSAPKPYSVTIKIKCISKNTWFDVICACEGKLDSLQELLTGEFPKALDEIFTEKENGLFPSPKEISFDCSCPDLANMCKHVAASLYGIGARLDNDPHLFFTLRKANVNDLIARAVKDKTNELLKKAGKKSSRVIEDADLSAVFGIEMDERTTSPKARSSVSKPKAKPKIKTKTKTKTKPKKKKTTSIKTNHKKTAENTKTTKKKTSKTLSSKKTGRKTKTGD